MVTSNLDGAGGDELIVGNASTIQVLWYDDSIGGFVEGDQLSTLNTFHRYGMAADIDDDGYQDVLFQTNSTLRVLYGGPLVVSPL
jgi:hypothetical protein